MSEKVAGIVRASTYTVSAVPEGFTSDSYLWDVTVENCGEDRWSVKHGARSLGRDGEWSSKGDSEEWLRDHRFSEAEALEMARQIAGTIVVNGVRIEDLYAGKARDIPQTRAVYLATCDRCGDPRWPVLFLNEEQRDNWIDNHREATTHEASPGTCAVPIGERDGRHIPHVQRDITGEPLTPRYHDTISELRHELNGIHFAQEALDLSKEASRLLYIAEQLGHTLDAMYGGFFQ